MTAAERQEAAVVACLGHAVGAMDRKMGAQSAHRTEAAAAAGFFSYGHNLPFVGKPLPHYHGATEMDQQQEGSEDDWLCFDADEVDPCKLSDILLMKGGGDSDMAYIAFYRAKI